MKNMRTMFLASIVIFAAACGRETLAPCPTTAPDSATVTINGVVVGKVATKWVNCR